MKQSDLLCLTCKHTLSLCFSLWDIWKSIYSTKVRLPMLRGEILDLSARGSRTQPDRQDPWDCTNIHQPWPTETAAGLTVWCKPNASFLAKLRCLKWLHLVTLSAIWSQWLMVILVNVAFNSGSRKKKKKKIKGHLPNQPLFIYGFLLWKEFIWWGFHNQDVNYLYIW